MMISKFNMILGLLSVLLMPLSIYATENSEKTVSLDSVMNLFVQNTDEATIEPDSAVLAQRALYLKFLKEKAEADSLRGAMQLALAEKRYGDFKKIVDDAETFERMCKPHQVIWNSEKLWVKYFASDFSFLSNVDSVDYYKHTTSRYGFYADLLRSEIELGTFDKTLEEIENESDRTFISLLLIKMIERKSNISDLILKNKTRITKIEQLHYLVENYWDMTALDEHRYFGLLLGVPYSLYMGDISRHVKSSFGADHGWNGSFGFDFIFDNFLHELIIDFNYGDYKDVDSLYFYDSNVDYNFGYTFLNMEYLRLYGFVSIGVGINQLFCENYEDDACPDKKMNHYFSYGAGGMADVLFTKRRQIQFGVRLRTGIKNVWANDLLNASGYRLYASVELLFLYYKKKKLKFEY